MTLKLTFLVFALLYTETKCACRQSFMTFCDDLEDLDDLDDYTVENWTDLVIGDENADSSKLKAVDFDAISLDRYNKLINFIIVRQIMDIKRDTFGIDSEESKIEYLKLYGNEIRRIRAETFHMKLRKLGLANNSIEYIHEEAFYNCEIKTIDLSNNKLEKIEKGVFTEEFLGNETKEIIFTNNELDYIAPNSLPSSLEILNLDYNNLDYFDYNVFEKLVNLQVLTLSHNKMRSLPNLKNLTEIIVIDASHNFIINLLSTDFNKLTQLEVLDLSHNRIFDPAIFRKFNFPQRHPSLQISLAFNRLTHLLIEGDSFRHHIVLLYGNPWNCKCWECLEKFMVDNQVKRNECDLKFFGNGEVPFCIYYTSGNCTAGKIYTQTVTTEVEQFLERIKKTQGVAGCKLHPREL